MAVGQHKLSRRALLGAVCASRAVAPIPSFPRKRESSTGVGSTVVRWIPDQVRDDEGATESSAVTNWDRAHARFHAAQVALDAAASEPDQDRYDALLDTHGAALAALLALPAPDLPALAAKLEIIVPNLAWETGGSEDCLEILRRDARSLASPRPELSHPKHQRG